MSLSMTPAAYLPATAVRKSRVDMITALLMAYAALLPFEWAISQMVRFSAADMVMLGTLFLAMGQLRYRQEDWSAWHYALLALFAFSTLSIAVQTGSLPQYVYLNKDAGLIILFLSYLLLTSILTTWTRIRFVLRAFVISVVLQNLVGLAAWVASTRLGIDSAFVEDNGLRLCGLMGDANAYGGLLITAFVISEGACMGRAPLFRKPFLMFARMTLAAGILVSFSRTAWISLSLVFLFLLVTRFEKAIRGLFLLLVGFAVTMIFMGSRFLALFENLAFRHEVDTGAGRSRMDLITNGLSDFGRHPFFGMGIGAFLAQQGAIVHNSAVWFLTEFGLIGFTILIGFLLWFLLRGISAYRLAPEREKPIAFALLLGFLAMSGVSLGIEAFYQRHWWLMFSLIAASYSIARKQRRPRLIFPDGFATNLSRSASHG